MTYIPDGSTEQLYHQLSHLIICVGWLDPAHEFPKKPASPDLLDSLWAYCSIPFEQTRGRHFCPWCEEKGRVTWREQTLQLGSAEVVIFGAEDEIYVAPNLVFHYMQAHDYRPPDGFVRALKDQPVPPGPVYLARLERMRRLNPYWRYRVVEPNSRV